MSCTLPWSMTDDRTDARVDRPSRADGAVSLARDLEQLCSDVSSCAVFCIDPQGVILTWNPGVRAILGYSPEEFVGRHIRDLLMEAGNREKDAGVAVLAHELKQPLNGILGWAKLGETGRVSPDRTSDVFSRIARAADATVHLVDDLLDVSRIASGKLQLTLVVANLGDIIRDTVAALKPEAEARSITLTSHPGITCSVRADPVRFRQVISNLVDNAIKYTPRGGSIRVSARVEDDHVLIAVADTGVGIAPDDLPVIFERFRQSDAADRTQSGLGLGLWVARQVVEQHGGTLEAFSDGPDKGAAFVVRIPCAPVDGARG